MIRDCQQELDTFFAETFPPKPPQERQTAPRTNEPPAEDMDVIEDCRRFRNGAKFERLMQGSTADHDGDDSGADFALASIIGFRTKDLDQIERIMRLSSLQRDKWDEKRGDTTYLRRTIETAVETVSGSYDPHYGQPTMPQVAVDIQPLQTSSNGAGVNGHDAVSHQSRDDLVCRPAAEWNALQARITELEAKNERLRAEDILLKTRVINLERIRKNRGLGNCKDTAAAILIEAETAHRARRVRTDNFFEVQMAAQSLGNPAEHTMQQLAGRSADTVRRDLQHLDRAGIIQTKTETKFEKWTDPQTGEVIQGPRSRSYVRLLCKPEELGNTLAVIDLKPLGRKTKEPKICPACGVDAGVTVKTIEVCNGCGLQTDLPDRERQPVAEEPQVAAPLHLVPMEAEPTATKEPQVAAHLRNNHKVEGSRKEPQLAVPLAGPSSLTPTLTAVVQEHVTLNEYQRTTEDLKQSHLANGKTYRLEVSA